MKVALATPTGHVGSKVAARLIDGGALVVLLCRQPEKVNAWVARGARTEMGDLEDGDYVVRATQGADALFWVVPPHFLTPDLYRFQKTLGQNAAQAVRKNGLKRVVNLSTMGAQMQSGAGPISGLRQVESALNETEASVTHLRPGYYMENYLFSLETIRTAGSVFLPVSGESRIPMIATQDVAAGAAKCLLDTSWQGHRVLGLQGPKDLSFDEAAGILGEAIGRPVRHVRVTPDQAREAFLALGASSEVAGKYVEMYRAFDEGLQVAEPRTPETTTPTTMSDFARTVLKPLLS